MNKPKDNIKENPEEHFFKEIIWTLVMKTQACNPALGETEAGRLLWIQSKPQLHSKF